MRLRIKAHIATGAILLALAALAVLSAKVIMLDAFEDIERRLVEKGAKSYVALIKGATANLENTVADWSYWDETYEFAASPSEDYIKRNCYPEGLSAIGIDLIAVFNTEGEQILAIGNDPWEQKRAPMPEGWLEGVMSWPAFFAPPAYTAAVSGILMLPEGPVMVAARQILSSERRGPTRGTMFMGKRIDAGRIKSWEEILGSSLGVYAAGADGLPPDVGQAATILKESPDSTAAIAIDGETMAAYGLLHDVTGMQSIVVRSSQPRTIYKQAALSMRHFVLTLAAFGLLFWLAAAAFMERGLLRRIIGLDAEVVSIAESGDAMARVSAGGADELARLGGSINTMLSSLNIAQERLAEANERLERANSAKTEFTSMVSHELRTPLGTIKQALEMAREELEGPAAEKQAQRLDIAKRNVDRLVHLTNELLDFTRLETGRIEMRFDKNDLGAIISDVFHLMKPAAEEKGVALVLKAPSRPTEIVCDADKIKQALINLVNNATKFTDSGGKITLSGEAIGGGARIEVEDTGRGIREEDLPGIFEPFHQIKACRASSCEGSGLGLSICNLLVKRHGGSVAVKSVQGEGSTFSITLPDNPPDTPESGGLFL